MKVLTSLVPEPFKFASSIINGVINTDFAHYSVLLGMCIVFRNTESIAKCLQEEKSMAPPVLD
jgi:hypothetical protein